MTNPRAGDCINVKAQVVDGNQIPQPQNVALTVRLATTPADALRLFADSQCTNPINSFTILAGQSSQTFYVLAVSGGMSTVNAISSTFGSTPLVLNVIGAVQRGTCLVGIGALSVNCPIATPQLDLNHTLLVYQAIADGLPTAASVTCTLQAANSILCSRLGMGVDVTVHWQTLELPSRLTVQRARLTPCVASATLATQPVTSESFHLLATSGPGDVFGGDDLTIGRFMSPGILFDTAMPCGTLEFQAVTWSGITTLQANAPGIASGAQAGAVVGLSAASANSVLLVQQSMVGGPMPGNADICEYFVRGDLDTPTTLRFKRGANAGVAKCSSLTLGNLRWQRIDFGTRAQVQTLTTTMAGPLNTDTVTLPSAVDMTRTLVFSGGNVKAGLASGETSNTTDTNKFFDAVATFELISSTQVRLTRINAKNDGVFTWYALQVEP